MEFRTRVVTRKRNKRAYIAYAGLVIAASSLLLVFIPSMEDYIPYVFGGGIAVVVIGAIIARGDVRNYGLSSDELIITDAGITVGAMHYPFSMITEMDFNVEAYEGLYVNDGAMVSGSKSDGMTNDLSFKAGGSKVSCGFYLQSQQHVQSLGLVFHELYLRRMPFIERNRSRRTYLLQFLSDRELQEFKERYGYR